FPYTTLFRSRCDGGYYRPGVPGRSPGGTDRWFGFVHRVDHDRCGDYHGGYWCGCQHLRLPGQQAQVGGVRCAARVARRRITSRGASALARPTSPPSGWVGPGRRTRTRRRSGPLTVTTVPRWTRGWSLSLSTVRMWTPPSVRRTRRG